MHQVPGHLQMGSPVDATSGWHLVAGELQLLSLHPPPFPTVLDDGSTLLLPTSPHPSCLQAGSGVPLWAEDNVTSALLARDADPGLRALGKLFPSLRLFVHEMDVMAAHLTLIEMMPVKCVNSSQHKVQRH